MKTLYSDKDFDRLNKLEEGQLIGLPHVPYRSDFWRDYSRLIHSAVFRRLSGKTQLFAGLESDFFRNRLTHSLEVAQIAKTIALKLNHECEGFKKVPIDTDLVEFAGLAHDLGHPPFGHNGEKALDSCMKNYGGFEGNAQTLRILSKIEKKQKLNEADNYGLTANSDGRMGLNLTMRSLASILKYDKEIPVIRAEQSKLGKGYYISESKLVKRIKRSVVGDEDFSEEFRTIECDIMDIADDIAYSVFDLEDALKAGFVSPLDFITPSADLEQKIYEQVKRRNPGLTFAKKEVKQILFELISPTLDPDNAVHPSGFSESDPLYRNWIIANAYDRANDTAKNSYLRNALTSALVGLFIRGVKVEFNPEFPALSRIRVDEIIKKNIEVLKYFVFHQITLSPRLKVAEYRGFEIVRELFELLYKEDGHLLLPKDWQKLYGAIDEKKWRARVVCDFIAGMTDRYAVEFYGRLTSENPESIFKPL